MQSGLILSSCQVKISRSQSDSCTGGSPENYMIMNELLGITRFNEMGESPFPDSARCKLLKHINETVSFRLIVVYL